jgi:outer membrane protein OmpA-like peptidoglycan-associated protein
MIKRKSFVLILLSVWVIFCLLWFFTIYQKDREETLPTIKPVATQLLPVTKVPITDTGSTTAQTVMPPTIVDSGAVLIDTSSVITTKTIEVPQPVAVPADTVEPQTSELAIKNEITSIKKIENGINKKLSVCYFYTNSDSKLKNFSHHISQKIQAYLTSANAKIIITGHTDYVGSVEYNYQLGLQRAERVKQILIKSGIAAERIEVVSMGEEKPIANNKSITGRARNRRVEINIYFIINITA